MKVAVLILNYNGVELLRRYLTSFRKAVAASRHDCRLAVVDNASTDGSVETLKKEFPDVMLYPLAENRVLCAYNEIASRVDDDVIILMNNDIRAEETSIDPLVEPFLKDEKVFFVTPKCFGASGRYEGNKTRGAVRYGLFGSTSLYPGYEETIDRPGLTFQGGFGAFDRKKFLALDGYDDLYLPGRLEDADICFRAFKRGWTCRYEPSSVVHHEGGTSFHKVFGVRKTLEINWRNTFLFMWKNLSDRILCFECMLWLPLRLLHSLLFGRRELWKGFWQAWAMRRLALARRRRLAESGLLRTISDARIFESV